MKNLFAFLFLFFPILSISQNSYQRNLYEIDKEIKSMEKRLINETLSYNLLNEKLDLVKSMNRLGEQSVRDSFDDLIDNELAELIAYTCEFGKQKLNLLESYRNFKSEFYLRKYDEISSVYLSFFLKVKTKE